MTPFEIVATLSVTSLVGAGAFAAYRVQQQMTDLRPQDDMRVAELLADMPNGHNSKILLD
ncbi:hypothetical protein [Sedimentitalea arenosa]|jgi:hypothetical protein|uniref:Uncharacterized protein n=1 Tax=Sedimentitalea arenosa TaxID=2798803 RepID=A0A8J7JH61_9RHOB|nr:hypothetical protein [Arenibacterium arenosum]MBJ6372019.1 hypothetical protein [Arenibacterium arenosum]